VAFAAEDEAAMMGESMAFACWYRLHYPATARLMHEWAKPMRAWKSQRGWDVWCRLKRNAAVEACQ
jgi:hypothetical protein